VSARVERRVGFACPECGQPGALAITHRLVLPGDRRADEIALEILACGCGFKGLAVTEELQSPPVAGAARKAGAGAAERMGFRLPAAAVDLLAYLIAQCPNPAEEYCPCPSHAALNRRDLRNKWNLLHSFAPIAGFALVPAAGKARAAVAYAYAPLTWSKEGEAFAVAIEGRLWRLEHADAPGAPPYALSIDGALELDVPVWPSFWRGG
jgi:hypothetical protein